MGWQDAPIVGGPAPAAAPAASSPAWQSAPPVEQPPAAAPQGSRARAAAQSDGYLLRNLANLIPGAIRGAGSIGATILAPLDVARDALAGKGLTLESNRARRQDMTDALQMAGADPSLPGFGVGKLGAEIAGTAGAGGAVANTLARVPGAATAMPAVIDAVRTAGFSAGGRTGLAGAAARAVGGAVTGGVSAGTVNPEDAKTGALVGAVLPGATQLAGATGRAVGGVISPRVVNPDLAKKAVEQYGIPLGVGDVTGNSFVKAVRSVLNDAPLTGGIGARQAEAVQQGFNRAVGGTFGETADSLTPQVLDAAKQRMGAEFDRLWNRNVLTVDPQMTAQMQALRAETSKLPQGEAARLASWLDDIESKMVPDAAGNMTIPGDVANRLQSGLRKQVNSASGFLKDNLQTLRSTLLGGFKRSVTPQDAQALSANMGQYKAFKTVEPLLTGAEAGVAGRQLGDVPAALLPQAVRQSYGANIANSPFADLSQIGSQYIADRVARTGGSARAMVQNSALGTALVGGSFANPVTTAAAAAAGIPTAMGVQKLLGAPGVTRAVLNAQPGPVSRLLSDPEFLQSLLRAGPVLATSDR